jgi:signal transduction histidine kinase/pSer/pThr/pTyr-binding forkhead associated (FHA) protein
VLFLLEIGQTKGNTIDKLPCKTVLEQEPQQIQHWLEIEDNSGKRIVILEAATCTLGRDSSNSIVLHSKLVSRQHAILLRVTTPGTANHFFRIIDGNLQGKPSTNGVCINKKNCFSHDLKHGDEITFAGDVKATYYCNSDRDRDSSSDGLNASINHIPPTQIVSNIEFASSKESVLVRLASFPELISNPILEFDLTGDITYINPAAVAQFPDLRAAKLQHPILAGIVERVQDCREKFFVREIEVIDKIFEQSVQYLPENDLVRSYIVDITARKHTELALRESEAKNRALLKAIPDLILRIGKDGTYLDYIPAKDSDFSATGSQMVSKNEYDVLPREVAQQRMHYVHFALETGKPQLFEYELHVNGKIRTEEARIVVSGKDEVLAIIRDITERKRVETLLQQAYDELELRVEQRTAELRQANQQLRREIAERQRVEEALRSSVATNRALLNAIPDSMFRLSQDGTLLNYKAAKDDWLIASDTNPVGKKLSDLFPPAVAQTLVKCVEQAIATGDIQVYEYRLILDEQPRDYEARIALSEEDEVMAIVRDITERKRAETEIRYALAREKELNELKSRFVTMASHEFRTPLTTILSSAELLEDYSSQWTEEKKHHHFQRVITAVKHMTGLLDDVLLIGKADAGRLEFNPSSMDLIEFCRELIEGMQITTTAHKIIFRTQGDCQNTCMDEKLLRQVLANLLSNAIKYSPKGGSIYFDLVCQQEAAIFRIQDQGIGIPPGDRDRLFHSFHRASNVGNISGTGLGLAIVKKSVALHGGQIYVKSQVGVGTIFLVKLPLYPKG